MTGELMTEENDKTRMKKRAKGCVNYPNMFSVCLSDEMNGRLLDYCGKHDESKTGAIRRAVVLLLEDDK